MAIPKNTEVGLDRARKQKYHFGMNQALRDARTRAALSQAKLAELAGTSQPQIKRLESGERELTKVWAEKLSPHLGVSAQSLLFESSADLAAAPEAAGFYRPPPQLLGERDLPVFAAVEGGPGAMVVNTDPIEWVQRPWFLREVKDGYAVVVTGESMSPVYEPGDIVIVNPRLPAIRSKNAIFVAGEERGEFRATVKRLERSTAKEWHVRQWNPPDGGKQDFILSKTEWPKALRIVGKYEGG